MKFKLLNFPIEIKPFFLVIVVFIGSDLYHGLGITGLLLWIITATLSILAHEFGHALWARWYGASPKIQLNGFGGLCSWQNNKSFIAKQDLIISLAGPLTGLALGILSGGLLLIAQKLDIYNLIMIAKFSIYCNIIWSLFNLLPIIPLDGGQAVRSIIKIFKGPFEEKLALQISYYSATILAIVSIFYLNAIILSLFFGYYAYSSHRQYKAVSQHWA